jgi:hypothetical protein
MAYVYISDDGPDAEEFESNYISFDSSDERLFAEIRKIIATEDCRVGAVRNRLATICHSSLRLDCKDHLFERIKRFAGSWLQHNRRYNTRNSVAYHQS